MRRSGLVLVLLLLLCSGIPAAAGSLQPDDLPVVVAGRWPLTDPGTTRYFPLILKNFSTPQPWTIITAEGFEAPLSSDWWLVDFNVGDGAEYHWARRDCRPFSGGYSVWGVGGGAQGASLACGSSYPASVNSYMIYGPFSLADATAAELAYKLWLKSADVQDRFCWGASLDGFTFHFQCTSGDLGGWIQRNEDISWVLNLGSLLGQPEVWVAFRFYSDGQGSQPEGVYLDEVLLTRCDAPSCISTTASAFSAGAATPPVEPETHDLKR